jgi:2-(1,2-epoxy-1,2-dihydrophenyl)acetyl-CoA isomerase
VDVATGSDNGRGFETLALERDGAVGLLTLNRPGRLNTMNLAMRGELFDCLQHVRADAAIRALVITGAGDAFSAGGDVNDFVARGPEEMHLLMREKSHRWFRALWELPIPTVAAVNGVAAGGGSSVLLACDFVIASERAQIGQTFVRVGLMPDLGGLFMLPRTLGLHRAKALALTGELISAQRAQELGLVHQVTTDDALLTSAVELANRLAAGSPAAYAATKAILNRSFETSMDQVLNTELYAQSFLFSTDDHRERLAEFLNQPATEDH